LQSLTLEVTTQRTEGPRFDVAEACRINVNACWARGRLDFDGPASIAGSIDHATHYRNLFDQPAVRTRLLCLPARRWLSRGRLLLRPAATRSKEARDDLEGEMVQQALKGRLVNQFHCQAMGLSQPILYEVMEKLTISHE